MTRETKHRKDETSFKGEMIENKLYNSADDVLDWDSKADNTSAARVIFLQHHISKRKPEDK